MNQTDEILDMLESDVKEVSVEKTEVRIQATHKAGGEETVIRDEKQVIKEDLFANDPPKVWMDYSITKNLGNYESLKFNVGISVPVGKPIPPELAGEIRKTYDYASEMIGQVIEKELAATMEMLRTRGK